MGADVALDGRSVPSSAVVAVPAGARLQGRTRPPTSAGTWRWPAGSEVPSCSGAALRTFSSGLGPGPLQAGDELAIGDAGHPRGYAARLSREPTLRILPGPEPVDLGSLVAWASGPFRVSPDSNRIGVRLEGSHHVELPEQRRGSHGVVHGAVQMPPSGEPIVLLCDHATMGGYPVIATVISADLGTLAQRRPGESVQFEIVDLEQALAAHVALDRQLARAPSGFYPSGGLS